jgi:predicted O-methyltransferase YrrM
LTANNAHGVHSPFIYDLYTTVIRKKKKYYAFDELLAYRRSLAHNKTTVDLVELGAGKKGTQKVIIQDIYHSSCHSKKDTKLLFKLAAEFKPHCMIELGTCLGLSSLYLAKGHTPSTLYTFEGNPDYAQLAKEAFKKYHAKNITLVEGNIHETLAPLIERLPQLDMAYIDAHHDFEPTVHFFKLCLSKCHEDSLIILDDIHWSPQMERAWEYIKQLDEVKQTVDLYQFGLVFFKTSQAKEHFVLRY